MKPSHNAERTDLLIRDRNRLALARKRLNKGDTDIRNAATKLKTEADQALRKGPYTIAEKKETPPSGDKRDYVSMGPYWWPNPDTASGLPYVRRDGLVNPETRLDYLTLAEMIASVSALSLGWFFFDETNYADRAAQLLRVFFLDEPTRMNPHLEFGQAIPGKCNGRGIGIIETTTLATGLLESIGLLSYSSRLTQEDIDGLRSWFSHYLDWLMQSSHGLDEKQMQNNHGTTYDLQVSMFSLFVGREQVARDILTAVPEERIIPQIEPDGRQPHELTRTKALGYSTMNLGLLFSLAEVAAKLNIDIWHFESSDGRSIRKALDWLVPFWTEAQPWPYQQISPFSAEKAYGLLQTAACVYEHSAYERAASSLSIQQDCRIKLLHPGMTDTDKQRH